MLTIAVFPNTNKPEAPAVLQRILSFYADKDVRVIMPVEEARFFQHAGYGVTDIENVRADIALSIGGDGTLSEVVSGLMQVPNPPPLGYIPMGTTNDVASTLGLPKNATDAALRIVTGTPTAFDVGSFGDKSFFTYVAAFGAFTAVSYETPQNEKQALGHLAYVLEAMSRLNSIDHYCAHVEYDGGTVDGDFIFGAVCNSTSIGGLMKLDPERVVLDDGKFEMLLVPSPKTAADLQNLVLALLNQQYDAGGLIFRHVTSLHVETDQELPWSLDGEYEPSRPAVDITNCQRALTMLL